MADAKQPRSSDGAPYHHGNLRQALIEAGTHALQTTAAADLSLRKLATTVGVSHVAAYRHFDGRDGLLLAIARTGYDQLFDLLWAAGDHDHPMTALRDIAHAYVTFATQRPHLFQFMFSGIADDDHPELAGATDTASDTLVGLARRAQDSGLFPHAAPPSVALLFWSVVHGVAMLEIGRQITPPFVTAGTSTADHLDTVLALLGVATTAPPPSRDQSR